MKLFFEQSSALINPRQDIATGQFILEIPNGGDEAQCAAEMVANLGFVDGSVERALSLTENAAAEMPILDLHHSADLLSKATEQLKNILKYFGPSRITHVSADDDGVLKTQFPFPPHHALLAEVFYRVIGQKS